MFNYLLLYLAHSSIKYATLDEAQEAVLRERCFVFVISSNSYEFPTILAAFRSAARDSSSDSNFYIVDVHSNSLAVEAFNLTQIPALIPFYNGKASEPSTGPFSQSSFLQFINIHSTSKIPLLKSTEDLEVFYQTTAIGVIVAIENASEDKCQVISEFYYHHFNEITVVFAEPKLMPKPGYYVYRFFDDTLVELPNLDNCTNEELSNTLYTNAVSEIHRFDSRTANYYEGTQIEFGILVINTGNAIYLNSEKLELTKIAQETCNINITYIESSTNIIPNVRYGFPDSQREMFHIVDARSFPFQKYTMEGNLTSANIQKFCQDYRKGEAERFWKSGSIAVSEKRTDIDDITAKNILEFINNHISVLGVYYHSDDALTNYSIAAKSLFVKNNNVKFGQFGIAYNDWPGQEEVDFQNLPRLLVFKNGKLVLNTKADTVESIVKNINNEIKKGVEKDL